MTAAFLLALAALAWSLVSRHRLRRETAGLVAASQLTREALTRRRREARDLRDHVARLERALDDTATALADAHSEAVALRRDLSAANLMLAAPVGIRREGSPRIVRLSADEVAFIRRGAYELAQVLCDSGVRNEVAERRLALDLRISGDRQ